MCKIGWNNRNSLSTPARVLRYIFRNRPVSRAEIAHQLGLSPAMVTSVIPTLINQGLVQDLGETAQNATGTSGRKRVMLGINPSARFGVGVEIGSRHFRFCLTDLNGAVITDICYTPTEDQIAHVNTSIEKGVNQLIAQARVDRALVIGVGIALPGHLNAESGGMVSHSTVWNDFNLPTLAGALGMKVTAENNVRAMAYQKFLFDHTDCPDNFVLLHVGAGIFCASFTDGQMAEGSYISGEVGHTVANPDGQRCECGKNGCLQTYASESWIVKKARTIYRASAQTILRTLVMREEDITFEIVMDAYTLGDIAVIRIIQDAIKYLGVAVANLAIIMNPQKIYLHSRLFQNEILRKELQVFIDSQLVFIDQSPTEEICILDFEPERAAIGASALAIDRLLIQNLN